MSAETPTLNDVETPAVVSSAPTATTVGEAVKEARQKKKQNQNQKSRTTRSGGVRYIPGESCIQLGKQHDFERRTAKGGRQYDVCKKCGSSKMVRDKDDTSDKTPTKKKSSGSKPESSSSSNLMTCGAYFTSNATGKMVRCDRRETTLPHSGKHSLAGVE